jgi:hypothetical protein
MRNLSKKRPSIFPLQNQNSLNVLRLSGGSSEAVGALGSAPIAPEPGVLGGKRYVFLESGQELQFTQSPGQLPTVLDPNLTVAGNDPQILLNLDDGGAGPDADFPLTRGSI